LDVALPIAKEHGAHLIGLHVIPNVPVRQSVEIYIPEDIIARQQQQLLDEAAAIQELLEERARSAGVEYEWRRIATDHYEIAKDVFDSALCADLVVLRQGTSDPFEIWANLPAHIALHCGRPVLTVPNAGKFHSVGKKVLIAWNGSREAARAAFDALPMISTGGQVDIVSIDAADNDGRPRFTPADELGRALSRQGFKVDCIDAYSGDIPVGDEILNRVSDHGYDLVVMGCYGHSRLRETIFGGVTRDLFEHMTAPVLMSH
jgi:nucleotide-binding universal stress UspA family protein